MPRIESPEELVKVRAEMLSRETRTSPAFLYVRVGCIASGAGKVIEAFKKRLKPKD